MSNARDTAKNLKTGLNIAADGTIIDVQKNGTSVGSIGISGGNNMYLSGQANNHAGVTFATQSILPTTQGTVNNNTVDIGQNGNAYKDLYLGGGLYVGGTGAANHLDDYETGSFTMTMTGESTGASLGHGEYVKIANVCHFQWYSGTRTISSVATPVLSGLPFTAASMYIGSAYPTVSMSHNTYAPQASVGYINLNTSSIYFTANGSSGGASTSVGSRYVMCGGTYVVA